MSSKSAPAKPQASASAGSGEAGSQTTTTTATATPPQASPSSPVSKILQRAKSRRDDDDDGPEVVTPTAGGDAAPQAMTSGGAEPTSRRRTEDVLPSKTLADILREEKAATSAKQKNIEVPAGVHRLFKDKEAMSYVAPSFTIGKSAADTCCAFQIHHNIPRKLQALLGCMNDAQNVTCAWARQIFVCTWGSRTWVVTRGVLDKKDTEEAQIAAKCTFVTAEQIQSQVHKTDIAAIPEALKACAGARSPKLSAVKIFVEAMKVAGVSRSALKVESVESATDAVVLDKLDMHVQWTAQFPKMEQGGKFLPDVWRHAVEAGLGSCLYMNRYGFACFLPGFGKPGSLEKFKSWVTKEGGKLRERIQGLVPEREEGDLAVATIERVDGATMPENETKLVMKEMGMEVVSSKHQAGAVKGVYIVKAVKGASALVSLPEMVKFTMWIVTVKVMPSRSGAAAGGGSV